MLIGQLEGETCGDYPGTPCYGQCASGLSCGSQSIFGVRHSSGFEDTYEYRTRSIGGKLPVVECQICVQDLGKRLVFYRNVNMTMIYLKTKYFLYFHLDISYFSNL